MSGEDPRPTESPQDGSRPEEPLPGAEPVELPAPAPAEVAGDAPFPRVLASAGALLLLLGGAHGLRDMLRRWFEEEHGYYGHGPLVLAASGWLLWRQRAALLAVPRRPHAAGALLLLLALPVLGLGLLEDVIVLQNAATLAGALGLLLVLFGPTFLARAWFPLAWLAFMVPLPNSMIEGTTFRLKLLAARLSLGAIRLAGIPALLEGGTIHFPSTSVQVEDVCSGLRTLITLAALSTLAAWLQPTRRKALLVLALAFPVAILANVVRILLLCALAVQGSEGALEGPLHEATGLLVYVLALGLLHLLVGWPDLPPLAPAPAGPRDPHARPSPGLVALTALPLVAGATLSLALAAQLWLAAPPEETHVTREIPVQVAGWAASELPLDEDVFRVLHTRDAIMLSWRRAEAPGAVDLYVTYAAGDIFRVAHPPERCFTGGGYSRQENGRAALELGGRRVEANRMLFRRGPELVLVYYWYRLNGVDVSNYMDYRFGSFLRRLRRYRSAGSMIRLTTLVEDRPGGLEVAEERLRRFAEEVLTTALQPLEPEPR